MPVLSNIQNLDFAILTRGKYLIHRDDLPWFRKAGRDGNYHLAFIPNLTAEETTRYRNWCGQCFDAALALIRYKNI